MLIGMRLQRHAFAKLNLYQDWAEVFRGEFGYHELVHLGIVAVKGGRRGGADEPEAPTADRED